MTDDVRYYDDSKTRVTDQLITREDKLILQIVQVDTVNVNNLRWNLYFAF